MKNLKNMNVCKELDALLYDEDFISVVSDDIVEIEERNVEGGDQLKKIIIRDIPYEDEQMIWRINFEKTITGLSKLDGTSTFEIALAILEDSVLNVCLIEMKTMIKEKEDKSTLWELKKKIEDSISRFYYLLCMGIPLRLGECGHVGINVDWEKFNNSKTKFCGMICYNKDRTKHYVGTKETERMYEILRGEARRDRISCRSNLIDHKIPLKFFKNPFSKNNDKGSADCFEIKFEEISDMRCGKETRLFLAVEESARSEKSRVFCCIFHFMMLHKDCLPIHTPLDLISGAFRQSRDQGGEGRWKNRI